MFPGNLPRKSPQTGRTWSRDSRDSVEGHNRRTAVANGTKEACSHAPFPPEMQMSRPLSSPALSGSCTHASALGVDGARVSPKTLELARMRRASQEDCLDLRIECMRTSGASGDGAILTAAVFCGTKSFHSA